MQANRCDRCGKLYSDGGHPSLVSGEGNVGYGYVYISSIESKRYIDLCQDCCREFEDWFRFDKEGNYAYKP